MLDDRISHSRFFEWIYGKETWMNECALNIDKKSTSFFKTGLNCCWVIHCRHFNWRRYHCRHLHLTTADLLHVHRVLPASPHGHASFRKPRSPAPTSTARTQAGRLTRLDAPSSDSASDLRQNDEGLSKGASRLLGILRRSSCRMSYAVSMMSAAVAGKG